MSERIVVYGADWCGDTIRTLRHLDRSGVKYDYIDIDNDKEGEKKVIAHSNGRRRIPLVEVATDGGEPQRIAVPRGAELDSMLGKKKSLVHDRNHIIQDPQRPDQQVDDVAKKRRLLVLVNAVPDELKNQSEDEEGDVDPHRKPPADDVDRDRDDQHGDRQPPFEREVVDDGDGDQD